MLCHYRHQSRAFKWCFNKNLKGTFYIFIVLESCTRHHYLVSNASFLRDGTTISQCFHKMGQTSVYDLHLVRQKANVFAITKHSLNSNPEKSKQLSSNIAIPRSWILLTTVHTRISKTYYI